MEKRISGLDETRTLLFNSTTYSLQKVEGLVSLDRRKVVLDKGLGVGDAVEIIKLPDGNYLLGLDPDKKSGLTIKRITEAYVQFDGEILVKEV